MNAAPLAAALAVLGATAAGASAQDRDRPADDRGQLERSTWRLVREAAPAVLSITVTTRAPKFPRLLIPGVMLAPAAGEPERIEATGYLATAQGHVVTTASLLRNANLIEIHFQDGTVRDAGIVGSDAPFQMAVLRTAPPRNPKPLSECAEVPSGGDTVAWFFNAKQSRSRPDVRVATVHRASVDGTAGYDRYLAAPLRLDPGSAGGPLVAGDGRLLGMAVQEVVPRTGGTQTGEASTLFVQGVDLQQAVADIVRHGSVQRPMLGVVLAGQGNRIDQLLPGSPAELAGLEEGDQIIGVDDAPVSALPDLTRALLRKDVGDSIRLRVRRGDRDLAPLVELSAFSLPPVPTTAPLPGAMLELTLTALASPLDEREVRVSQVVEHSTLHQLGLRAGDRLLRVDGHSAARFLARHRIRPGDTRPRVLEIERDGGRLEIRIVE